MKALIVFTCLMLSTSFAHAITMTVDADKFELFQTEKRAEFFGHVVVQREEMVLKADFMTVWYQEVNGKNELKRVKAKGNVFIDTPENKGTSKLATYSADTEMLIMSGEARMVGDQGVLEGEQIEYNTKTEDTRVLKGAEDKQVHFIFEDAEK